MKALAKVYFPKVEGGLICVSYTDPRLREKNGRSKRVRKWFSGTQKTRARAYARELNARLMREGTAGAAFELEGLRRDAQGAREWLDERGHGGVSLLDVAKEWAARAEAGAAGQRPIGEVIDGYLDYMGYVAEARLDTLTNLRIRLGLWVRVAGLKWVGDIDRRAVLALRDRRVRLGGRGVGPVSRTTRSNDLRVASAFCSWLVEREWLAFNPVRGVKRPDVGRDREAVAVWSVEELLALLEAARAHDGGRYLGALVAMNFIGGARPSEVAGVRIRYAEDFSAGVARIEGGKMGGRANRNVELLPVALAWLGAAGWPRVVEPMSVRGRRAIMRAAGGLEWPQDICRHTCISNLVELRKNDAAVARECGTSEAVIYSRYHNLRDPQEVQRWAGLRPS